MAVRINQEALGPTEMDEPYLVRDHLTGISYPAGKAELIEQAERAEVPESVLQALRKLPERQYENLVDVIAGVGESP